MALLAPITVAELDVAVVDVRGRLVDAASGGRASQRAQLRGLHELLIRATALSVEAPVASLAAVAELLGQVKVSVVDAMSPRPRTAFRLLRGGAIEAAWRVLTDNATGFVEQANDISTATGGLQRPTGRLPLLTRVEAPKVFADLPGFRDPRFDVDDDVYDITTTIRLRQGLDEICVAGDSITFGGWARLVALPTSAAEEVRLIAASSAGEIAVSGRRVRRPDMVSGTGDSLLRRAWAGWSVRLDLTDPRLVAGSWELSLELDHAGVVRRTPIGAGASDLAQAATRTTTRVGTRSLRWQTDRPPWCLVIK